MASSATRRRRKGGLSVVLTVISPGLGHLYAGEPVAGVVTFVLVLIALDVATALGAYACLGVLNFILLFAIPITAIIVAARHAANAAKRQPADYLLRAYNHWYVYVVLLLLAGFVGHLDTAFLKAYVAKAYRIPSTAMAPTLLVGDYLYVHNYVRTPPAIKRGQIVVFRSLTEPGVMVIERVCGVPGDTLQMRDDTLFVDGVQQVEPYTQHVDPTGDVTDSSMRWQAAFVTAAVDRRYYLPTRSNWGPIVVPAHSYLALGDDRDNSSDSRYYGFVPSDRIVARPLRLYFSYDPDARSSVPWLTAVRWRRIGQAVR